MGFTSLAYLMDLEWLREAWRRTRKNGAAGIDGQTAADYERSLDSNLQRLLDLAKSGRYIARPVKRVHIPKGGSKTETRPIGIPTLEDKILQRAVVMLLEPIYERDFKDCSYGFRPGRSAHDALESLWKRTMDMPGSWVLEVDIRKFFDTLDHAHLIRYADDFVIVFANESDARRVMAVLPKRFGKYGLTLHPEKTRLIAFDRPDDKGGSGGRPGTFDLLGFTHYWGRSRRGNWVIQRRTASSRMTRSLKAVADWCRRNRHLPAREQHRVLSRKLRGHCAYYGITGNSPSLSGFRMWVHRIWRYWLSRRNRERTMTWDCFNRLLEVYPLPPAVAVHSVYRHAAKP